MTDDRSEEAAELLERLRRDRRQLEESERASMASAATADIVEGIQRRTAELLATDPASGTGRIADATEAPPSATSGRHPTSPAWGRPAVAPPPAPRPAIDRPGVPRTAVPAPRGAAPYVRPGAPAGSSPLGAPAPKPPPTPPVDPVRAPDGWPVLPPLGGEATDRDDAWWQGEEGAGGAPAQPLAAPGAPRSAGDAPRALADATEAPPAPPPPPPSPEAPTTDARTTAPPTASPSRVAPPESEAARRRRAELFGGATADAAERAAGIELPAGAEAAAAGTTTDEPAGHREHWAEQLRAERETSPLLPPVPPPTSWADRLRGAVDSTLTGTADATGAGEAEVHEIDATDAPAEASPADVQDRSGGTEPDDVDAPDEAAALSDDSKDSEDERAEGPTEPATEDEDDDEDEEDLGGGEAELREAELVADDAADELGAEVLAEDTDDTDDGGDELAEDVDEGTAAEDEGDEGDDGDARAEVDPEDLLEPEPDEPEPDELEPGDAHDDAGVSEDTPDEDEADADAQESAAIAATDDALPDEGALPDDEQQEPVEDGVDDEGAPDEAVDEAVDDVDDADGEAGIATDEIDTDEIDTDEIDGADGEDEDEDVAADTAADVAATEPPDEHVAPVLELRPPSRAPEPAATPPTPAASRWQERLARSQAASDPAPVDPPTATPAVEPAPPVAAGQRAAARRDAEPEPEAGRDHGPPPGPSAAQITARVVSAIGVLLVGFVGYLFLGGTIRERQAQDDLRARFDDLLATADGDGVPSQPEPGAPVALLSIPELGVERVVVEGSDAASLRQGPGHYRASRLPGQSGNAVVLGRRTTYGSPFGDLDRLARGDEIEVTTAQGTFTYEVAISEPFGDGDPDVFAPSSQRLLTLVTSEPAYVPSRYYVVIARLRGTPAETPAALPIVAGERGLAVRPGTAVPLALAYLLLLVAVGLLALALSRRIRALAWVLATPVFLVLVVVLYTQLERLLPPTL